jgi:AMMECR1 domain-containing protein
MLTRFKLTAIALFAACVAIWPFASVDAAAESGKDLTLPEIVRLVEAVHFGEKKLGDQSFTDFARSLPVSGKFRGSAGVFVTLSYKGKTRACWGNFAPQQPTIAESTVYAALGALTKEYRFPPIEPHEWKKLKPQVTVIRGVDPISNIRMQNPLRDGLLVRSGGKAGVLLPGEAADAYFQLVQCKLKAGIKPVEPCQLYRLRTEIYE